MHAHMLAAGAARTVYGVTLYIYSMGQLFSPAPVHSPNSLSPIGSLLSACSMPALPLCVAMSLCTHGQTCVPENIIAALPLCFKLHAFSYACPLYTHLPPPCLAYFLPTTLLPPFAFSPFYPIILFLCMRE